MGLFRRIIKMLFRDTLFRIPKKYLIVIIMFLSLYLLKSNVFAYSDYDTIQTDSPAVDCIFYNKVRLPQDTYFDLHLEQTPSFRYQEGGLDNNYWFQIMTYPRNFSSGYYDDYIILQEPNQLFKLEINSNYGGGRAGLALSLAADYNNLMVNPFGQQWGTDLAQMNTITFRLMTYTNELSGNLSNFVVQQGENVINSGNLTFGENSFNYDGTSPLVIGGGGQYGYFYNWKGGISNADDTYRTSLFNYYPCKMIDTSNGSIEYIPGAYDIVTGTFVYFDDFIFDDNDIMSEPPQEIQDYTPPIPPTPEPTPIDYTGSIDNVNNSINSLNNNIMSEDTNGIDTDIYVPVATSTEATSLLNIFNTNVQNWITALEDDERIYSVTLYLPNFLNANSPYTITLYSNMLKNALNGINIPGFSFNAYFIVQVFWYLALGGYLAHLILRLYQAFTDGEITNLSSWSKKINDEYTKISMFII